MRKSLVFIFYYSLVIFFFSTINATAGGLERARTKTNDVVNAAIAPGTYAGAEKAVNETGRVVDQSFDHLVMLTDSTQISSGSKKVVESASNSLSGIDSYTNRGLDAIESLSQRLQLQDLTQNVLQGSDVKISPYFKANMEYDSNVFYEPEAPKTRDEVLWVWTPGVSINVPFGDQKQYRVGAVYEARFTDFTRFGEHDDVGQSLGAVGNFKLRDDLAVNVTEEFVKDAARAGTRSAKRVEYTDQIVTPSLVYDWRNWTFEGEYKNAIRNFGSAIYRAFDYDNNAFTARLLRDIAPHFRGLAEYTFSHYNYDHDGSRVGRYNQIRFGVKGDLSERTNVLARVGYQQRNYRRHDTDFDVPVADVLIRHSLTDRTKLDLYFQRTLQESQFTNNRAYDEKLGQISASYLFTEKLRGRAGGSLAQHKFQNEAFTGAVLVKRRDLIGSTFVGLDYMFRPWLITNIDYRYERSNSNNSNFDYTNNVLSLGMTMPL